MKKLFLLSLILILISSFSYSQSYKNLNLELKKESQSKLLTHGVWGVYAQYVKSGKVILDYNSEKSLAPASGLKVFTTITALNLLGENYKYKTKVYYNGEITKGVLNGDVYIVGGGDPTLGSNLVKGSLPLDSLMMSWTNAIKAKGITSINGSIIAEAHYFEGERVPDYWNWMDIGNYYGAGPSSLSINNNLYYLYFKPADKVGDLAKVLRTQPEIPGLKFQNYMKTGAVGSGDNGYIYSAPEQFEARLRGSVPAGVKEFSIKGSIPDPPLFAAQYFEKYLNSNGVKVSEPAKKIETEVLHKATNLITETLSPPLKDIVYITNKKSDNLYAETLMRTFAKVQTGIGSTEKGVNVLMNFLDSNGIKTEGIKLHDGCGLSRTDMITPKAMAQLLAFMTKQKVFDSFWNSLAVAGIKNDPGYFKNFGSGTKLQGNARIKSGLISDVRSESGYVYDGKGRLIVFSMIANNYTGTSRQVDELHKKILLKLAELH